ncbi:sericin-1-like [Dreissena polymorpha]|uniref:sericin-1-like n=1 Tax=Dreissena polymorpha TaxID=45954 RepID=UPI0022647B64|nr:sericin-1-like [Dreissena polymorpha]
MGSVPIGIGPGSGRGTSICVSDGRNGTSGLETGSGTGGSESVNGTSGSGTGSGTSDSGTGGGSSGSGTGSGKSGSGAGSGTGCSGPGSGTGGNQSGRYDSFAGSSSADGNFSAGCTSMPWWLILLVVSLELFVVNLIPVLLYVMIATSV